MTYRNKKLTLDRWLSDLHHDLEYAKHDDRLDYKEIERSIQQVTAWRDNPIYSMIDRYPVIVWTMEGIYRYNATIVQIDRHLSNYDTIVVDFKGGE